MKCEMEWVPCSERLPEPGVPVITAIYGSDLIVPLPRETLAEAVDRIFWKTAHEIANVVKYAPTIVPAEGGGEDG